MNSSHLATLRTKDGRVATVSHVTAHDAPDLLEYVEAVAGETDFLTFGPGEFGIALAQEVEFIRSLYHFAKGLMLKVVVDGELVGTAMLNRSSRPRLCHVGDLGISVRKPFWGQGIGGGLLATTMDEGRRLGMTRIALRVRADNRRAIRLYERLGFQHEGRLVGAMLIAGQLYDELVMARQI